MKQIWSFVLTGGPCSGKTTGLSTIEQELSQRGYFVLIVPEAATELISTGIRPFGGSLDVFHFQCAVFEKQLYNEKLYRHYARLIPHNKIVIIHDRGIMDGKAYLENEQFKQILSGSCMDEISARDRYDGVFHLVTAANGAESFYTLSNNAARMETPEAARKADDLTIRSWNGHPHLRIIDNSTDFEGKMNKLISGIYSLLGEPSPIQIQRKFLIQMPKSYLNFSVPITSVDIVQTYLKSNGNIERRIRQRGQNGSFSYYYSEKEELDNFARKSYEKKISQKDYISYLAEMDNSIHPIVKKRLCFVYNSQYFAIDIFNFSDNLALMEIELTPQNSSVDIPDFINVIKEVTNDTLYRNFILAKSQTL